jgi:hypothetical protein
MTTFNQTSFNYQNVRNELEMKSNLDRDLKTIYSSHSRLDNTVVKSTTFGGQFSLASGVVAVANGAKTAFATGLDNITAVVVSLDGGQGVALNLWVTANPAKGTPGGIDIFVWKPTAAGNNTPTQATGTFNVHWIACGSSQTTT